MDFKGRSFLKLLDYTPEEIAYLNGWISKETLLSAAAEYGKSPYGEHLRRVADGKIQY